MLELKILSERTCDTKLMFLIVILIEKGLWFFLLCEYRGPTFNVLLFIVTWFSLICRDFAATNCWSSTIQFSWVKNQVWTETSHWPTSWGRITASRRVQISRKFSSSISRLVHNILDLYVENCIKSKFSFTVSKQH